MTAFFSRGLGAAALATCIVAAGTAQAVTITFTATNLPDTLVGQDLWRYDYRVSGNIEAFGKFTILFDPVAYGALSNPLPQISAAWGLFPLVNPNPATATQGVFSAQRSGFVFGPVVDNPFSVTFVWLGSGPPGAQPFQVNAASGALAESGVTFTAVPEPQSYAMLAAGLIALAVQRARHRPAPPRQCT